MTAAAEMPHHVRAALRIVAFHGPPSIDHEAQKRMTGAGSPAMWAKILEVAARQPAAHWPSPQDHEAVLLGAVAATAGRADLLAAGAAAGLSQRAMAAAAGVSHTAVQKRLAGL